jgi:phage/conjugal plasmid C-4 type zinc finger TraR family protein
MLAVGRGMVRSSIRSRTPCSTAFNAEARIPIGEGTPDCVECGDEIPEARRKAMPGATTCVQCQSGRDGRIEHSAINRRGSKHSQLQ